MQDNEKTNSRSKKTLRKIYLEKQKNPCIEVVNFPNKKSLGLKNTNNIGETNGVVKPFHVPKHIHS